MNQEGTAMHNPAAETLFDGPCTHVYSWATEPHQQRMVEEYTDLSKKLVKLQEFFGSDTHKKCTDAEQVRLLRQYEHMTRYAEVLFQRLYALKYGLD